MKLENVLHLTIGIKSSEFTFAWLSIGRCELDVVSPSSGLKSRFHWLGWQVPQLPPHTTNAACLSSKIVSSMISLRQPLCSQIVYGNNFVFFSWLFNWQYFRPVQMRVMAHYLSRQGTAIIYTCIYKVFLYCLTLYHIYIYVYCLFILYAYGPLFTKKTLSYCFKNPFPL